MYDSILVPTDGSDVAEAAVDQAVGIADKYDATLHALYVADTDAIAYRFGTEEVEKIKQGEFGDATELREQAEAATGYVAQRAKEHGVAVVEHHTGGQPHSMIANHAEDQGTDLIVMGSHGRSGVRRALLGSVTERVLRSTEVSVLVVNYGGNDTAESATDP
jgi:nucleotide-binding universal stress UspA family protein